MELITHAESIGFEDALINTAEGALRDEEIRNNDRVISDDPSLSAEMWERLQSYMPQTFKTRTLVGLNERMRFYRYKPGQIFDWHQDGYYERETGERSQFTFMVYLIDGFEGGDTTFADVFFHESFKDFKITPRTGSALLFYHPISHRGDRLIAGTKYVLRSDVMYSAKS